MMKQIQKEKGFTLIEMMLVVAVVGILAMVSIPLYQDYVLRSMRINVVSAVEPIKMALSLYYQEHGNFPVGTDTLTQGSGTGPAPLGSIWNSLGFSSYPSLPGDLVKINYASDIRGNTVTLSLQFANLQEGAINDQLISVASASPSSTLVSGSILPSIGGISTTSTAGSTSSGAGTASSASPMGQSVALLFVP